MTPAWGYDPARVVALRHRTQQAVADLDAIRLDDPDAADALQTVRLTRQNLAHHWLPFLDAIHRSDAMTSWRSIGADADALARVVAGLADAFGINAGWVSTSAYFDVPTATVVGHLRNAIDRYREVLDGRGGDPVAVRTDVRAWLGELAARVDTPADAAIAWNALGVSGLDALIDVTDRDLDAVGRALLASNGDDLGPPALTVIATVAELAPADVVPAVVAAVSSSEHLAALTAERTHQLGTALLVAITAGVAAQARTGLGGPPSVLTDALLAELAERPDAARTLVLDRPAATAIVAGSSSDEEIVEQFVASALARPGADAVSRSRRLEAVAAMVTIAEQAELGAGARRGAARALGTHLAGLAPHLDVRLPVHASHGGGAPVELGAYTSVSRFVGQLLDDEDAQLALGVAIGGFRNDQLRDVTRELTARTDLDPAAARSMLAGALADVSRVLELVRGAAADRNALLELRHGMARSTSDELISLVSMAASWVIPPAAPLTRQVSAISTQALRRHAGQSAPPTVPRTGFDTELAIDLTRAVVGLPAGDHAARRRLGLERVASSTWQRIDELVRELDVADGTDERAAIHARLRRAVADDHDLDAYLEAVMADSGHAALGRPGSG